MKLSILILIQKLTGQFVFDILGQTDGLLRLSRPVFLTSSTTLQDDGIYVFKFRKNEEIPLLKIHSLLLTKGRILENLKDQFDCILSFSDDTDLYEVVNCIHSVFDLYENWLRDISELSRKSCTLTELLDRSHVIFSNPLMIHDKNFQVISCSSIMKGAHNLNFFLEHSHSSELLSNFMIDRQFRETFSVQKSTIFPDYLTGTRSIYKNIFSHGKMICRILILERLRTFQESDLYLLDIFSEYIKDILTNEDTVEDHSVHTLNQFLLRMLKDDSLDDYTIERTLNTYDWTFNCHYFCIKFQLHQVDAGNYFSNAISEYLETQIKGSCAFQIDYCVTAFFNLSKTSMNQEEILRFLTPFIRDQNLKAGISGCYQGFSQCFQLLYRQACISLDLGLSHTPYKWIHHFDEIRTYYILDQCVSQLPASMVCCPEILKIYEYDKQHHTDYFHTLKVYLNHNLQPVATAKELYIHRTTFLYRIQKITQKFSIDLSVPQKVLLYQLSIALLEYANPHKELLP